MKEEDIEIKIVDGIPCIVLDDINGIARTFGFSILLSRKNDKLSGVLRQLRDWVNKNKDFGYFM